MTISVKSKEGHLMDNQAKIQQILNAAADEVSAITGLTTVLRAETVVSASFSDSVSKAVPELHLRVQTVFEAVELCTGVTKDMIIGERGKDYIVDARRFVVYFLITEAPEMNLDEIAHIVGRKDHSAAIHLRDTIHNLIDMEPEYKEKCEAIKECIIQLNR